jgi:hypothetical protein
MRRHGGIMLNWSSPVPADCRVVQLLWYCCCFLRMNLLYLHMGSGLPDGAIQPVPVNQYRQPPLSTYNLPNSHYQWPRYGHDTSNIAESLNSAWRNIRTLQPLKMDSIWSYIVKTVHDRKIRPQMVFAIPDVPWKKFQDRVQAQSSHFNVREFDCSCLNF